MTVLIIGGAYQGKSALAKKLYPNLEKVYDLHVMVGEVIKSGAPAVKIENLLGKCVTCDEIGCGIVPIEREHERWREETGRLCCALAEKADTVIRVIAGMPQYIKGGPF